MRRNPWSSILQRLSALALGIVLAGAATELAVRALRPTPDSYDVHPRNFSRVLRPARDIMPGVAGDSLYKTNSLGLRGDELSPTHQPRIIALGGSTVECLYLDQSEAWPQLVQDSLDAVSPQHSTWVGNAGKSGLTSRHHRVQLDRLPLEEWGIDTALLLVGVNDLLKRLARDLRYDPRFDEEQDWERQLLREAFYSFPDKNRGQFLRFPATLGLLREVRSQFRTDIVQDDAGLIYAKWRRHRQQATTIRAQLPDLRSALEEYSGNLDKIIMIAREKGIQLVLITQPAIWQEDLSEYARSLLWVGGVGRYQERPSQPYYSVTALGAGLALYNSTLIETCERWKVRCIDLAALLPRDAPLFYDDVHVNERGAQVIAEIVSRHLINWRLLQFKISPGFAEH